jgi:hypothetical protein
VKRLLVRPALLELPRPVAAEVDRVGEDQARVRTEYPGRDEIPDLLLGLLRDPAVDLAARALGVGLKSASPSSS